MSNDPKLRKTSCISYFCEQHHEDKPGHHKLPTIKECVATIRANTPGQTKIAANSFNLMPKKTITIFPTLSHIYQLRNPIRRERPPKQVGFQGPSLPLHPPPGQSPPPPSTQPPTPRLMDRRGACVTRLGCCMKVQPVRLRIGVLGM